MAGAARLFLSTRDQADPQTARRCQLASQWGVATRVHFVYALNKSCSSVVCLGFHRRLRVESDRHRAGHRITVLAGDGNGPGLGNYSLHLQRTNAPGHAAAMNFGDTLPGSIDFGAEVDAYTFSASAGDKVVAKMSLASSGFSLQFSPRLQIFQPDGSRACLAQSIAMRISWNCCARWMPRAPTP